MTPKSQPPLPLEIIDEADVSAELDREVRTLLCECFPSDGEAFSRARAWHGSVPAFLVVCRAAGRVVGHVAIVDREISCDGRLIRVAGVQSLAVASVWRGSGLGPQLMREAMDEARRRGISVGLLFCVAGLTPFYARLGWTIVRQPVNMRDEQGRAVPLPAKNVVMQLPSGGKSLPPGRIDLNGPDW